MNREKHYLDEAAKIAMKSSMRHKHGCIARYGKSVVASGYNHETNAGLKEVWSLHAEAEVLKELQRVYKDDRRKIQKCKVYVVRISNEKDIYKMSKPCSICKRRLEEFGIKEIYYSDIEFPLSCVHIRKN
jgi:deoxycytidylate deaminase